MRVLVVDDSPIIRARLVSMLRELPAVTVDEADGADAALAAIAARAPQIVILDVHMPGRTGISILREIKSGLSPPLLIVMTSYPTEHVRRRCLAEGADFFFDKSKHFERVIDVVVGLDRERASRGALDRS